MGRIPKKLRDELLADPFYRRCARAGLYGHECGGRITFEHAMIYADRQIQERWAILPICEKGHGVGAWQDRGDLIKEIHEWIALNRATTRELLGISKGIDYFHRRGYLNKKYGRYHEPQSVRGIDYPWIRQGV